MVVIKVEYTVREEYAETNRKNIEKVMFDLRQMNNPNIKYSTYVKEDGKSFVHFAQYPDAETGEIVTSLDSFQYFRSQLLASDLEAKPENIKLQLVGSAYDIF